MQKPLQWISSFLQLMWLFFPGILILSIAAFVLNSTILGRDLLISGFQSAWGGWFLMASLLFWSLVTWYSSRLISFNNHSQHRLPAWGLTHIPRWLGFQCFSIIFTAIAQTTLPAEWTIHPLLLFLGSSLIYLSYYGIFTRLITHSTTTYSSLLQTLANLTALGSIVWMAVDNDPIHWLLLIPLLQLLLLHLVTMRRRHLVIDISTEPASVINLKKNDPVLKLMQWLFKRKVSMEETGDSIEVTREKGFLRIFSLLAALSLLLYLLALIFPPWARTLSPLPILLLGFGILLGAGNILSMLSFKLKINFHFVIIAAIILAGLIRETHWVKLMNTKTEPAYTERPALRPYFNKWMAARNDVLAKTDSLFPVYLVMSDGGASRSAYWTASVLSKMDSLMSGSLYQNMFSLSGSSGGSLGNLAFVASQQLPFSKRLSLIQSYLSADFLSYPLLSLLLRDILLPLMPGDGWNDRANALEQALQNSESAPIIDSFMQSGFSKLNPSNANDASLPVIFINCTRMQDGTPAAVSNIRLDKKTFGQRIDILRDLQQHEDISIAGSIVLGARFPVFSPAGRIRNNYFVDAGYLDNSGAGITHEMLIDLHALITDSLRINPEHPYGKIRFHVLHITNSPEQKPLPQKVHPLLNDLAAPVMTLFGTNARQTDYNNLRLKKYLQEINGDKESYRVINLYENGLADDLPMNWTLSPKAVEKINKRLSTTPPSLRLGTPPIPARCFGQEGNDYD